ncbi:hypothetical protein EW145_g4241 [Phellinidium pouzarii]|uniref:Uncharacterized protein n=1 Tax=Phellinidium pouzarii TaxID=167371 RepID=A0A4S4L4G2_9AGAM|nr:hypothetical protein EW145_g4241 [Phellinidium pouzarii]
MKPLATLLKTLLFGALLVSGKHGESEGGEDATTSSVSAVNSTTTSATLTSTSSTPTASTAESSAHTLTISSTTSNTPSPTSTNVMQFDPPGNITTCTQATFAWSYNLTMSLNMTIIVTNERTTTQHFASKLARRQAALVSQTLSTTVDARACEITWAQADVPVGQYALVAFDTARTGNISIQSDAFFVVAGADTSCLSTPASSNSDPSQSGSSGQEGAFPSSQAGSKSLSTGALAGTIAGVVIGVGGLLMAFTLPRFRRHRRLSAQPPRPGAPYHLF